MVAIDAIHVEPQIKQEVEKILTPLGLSTSDVINALFNHIVLRGGLPFEVRTPEKTCTEATHSAKFVAAMEKYQKEVASVVYTEDEVLADIMALRYGKNHV
ncbi:MAG: type II toxin-antitoxin system RelB/DinJ family antitoxin [Defluviitaleaceae bacterium]|nr:type II toxin-antitoxin system RelB/DinJ family antitoxin [Defluviitaleaceae bacterium]MCL2274476.1 type II toxin-antitoxin system RelB/DinJ family antitoxin [Defluviitaleaceae bacterium]